MIKNKYRGVTLLEAMLVLFIAASILLMGVQMVQNYSTEQEFRQVKYNVDLLFQAMGEFYQANCQSGRLSPIPPPPPPLIPPVDLTKPFSVDIQIDLIQKQYLDAQWPSYSSRVDDSVPLKGYAAQYNIITNNSPKSTYACFYSGTGQPQCGTPINYKPIPGSQIILWQSQVAVKLKNKDDAQKYKGLVGADCVVDAIDMDKPVNCTTDASNTGVFLVWQRLPTYAPSVISSGLWLSTPVTKEFNLQYTHDPMYEMDNSNAGNQYKYYLCGG